MHHPTDRITHTTAFVTPVVEHWLEREIAQWVHPMKDRSDDPPHHERTLLGQWMLCKHRRRADPCPHHCGQTECKVTECVLGNSCGIYPVMWKNIYVKSQNVCLGTLVEYTLSCGKR